MTDKIFNDKVNFENTIEFAKSLDANDPLKNFRERFMIPSINGKRANLFSRELAGTSVKKCKREINKILDQWASFGVEGFLWAKTVGWITMISLQNLYRKLLVQRPNEITVMNQLTVNLHLMMVSFYRPGGQRNKILCEAKAFPSDQYMFETHIRSLGLDPDEVLIEVNPREGEHLIRNEDILNID